MLKCAHCDKVYKYESERKRHQKSHFPQFQCKVCCKKFTFLSALTRHRKQHDRNGTVHCRECGGEFRDETLLLRHFKYAHTGKFPCSQCSTLFSSELALQTHSKSHKPIEERRFRCKHDSCNKAFNFSHHLKHHEMTHTRSKQHYCNVCGKGFIQSHHLKTHLNTHDSKKKMLFSAINGSKKKLPTECARKKQIASHKKFKNKSFPEFKMDSGFSSDSNSACGADVYEGGNSVQESVNEKDAATSRNCTEATVTKFKRRTRDETLKDESVTYPMLPGPSSANPFFCTEIRDDAASSKNRSRRAYTNVDFKNTIQYSTICSSSIKDLNEINNMPEIEYRLDGIIKIKDNFDTDITINQLKKGLTTVSIRDVKLDRIPYNSCQAVLGTCIVSEDGTIGEGCLCAKMAMDDQMSAQEIEEITPNPHVA